VAWGLGALACAGSIRAVNRHVTGGPGPVKQFVGRVDYRLPAGADAEGSYHVAVIDERQNRMAGWLADAEGGGWNGFMSALARRYDWLSAMAPVEVDEGYLSPGMTVSVPAGRPGPIVFAGNFDDGGGLTLDDLLVVLVFTGPDNQTYWAERVSS
jgi:hypothetical protein